MATLTSGFGTFTTGQTLTASDLNNHVTGATPLPDFINGQAALTIPDSSDQLLINDVDGSAVKKITLANIADNMPSITTTDLNATGNADVTGNLTVDGNVTLGDAAGDTVTVNGVATFGASATFNGAVSTTGNTTLGDAAADTITLNGTLAGTVQGTPVVSLTAVTDAYGDSVLIRDASDSNRLKMVAACLPKVWASISTKAADTTTVAATVSRTGGSTTATVTKVAHGLKVGDVIYLDNGVADGWYDIKTTPDADTFTVTTVATTALSSVATQWYALTVTGFGVSSAFKESTTSNLVNLNFTTAFASRNYAAFFSFDNTETAFPAAVGIVTNSIVIGGISFDRTTRNVSAKMTYGYTTTALNEGQLMVSIFGNL